MSRMRKLCAGKDHVLTRGDLPDFATTAGGSASCSNAGGDWAEGRKLLLHFLHTRHPWRNQQTAYDPREGGGRATQEAKAE